MAGGKDRQTFPPTGGAVPYRPHSGSEIEPLYGGPAWVLLQADPISELDNESPGWTVSPGLHINFHDL